MKQKLFGWIVCILLIGNAVPLVESSKNILIDQIIHSNPEKSMVDDWSEIQKLHASDGGYAELFSSSLSLDGNTALIGAIGDDGNGLYSGAVYVFTRIETTWIEQAKLIAFDGVSGDYFGWSVALDGDTALVGACHDDNWTGSVYVFTRTDETWNQQAKLQAVDSSGDCFGWSVALDGSTAVIGAYRDYNENVSGSGSVYVFVRIGNTWIQQTKLLASDGAGCFGWSVALEGNTALIGARYGGYGTGSAYVFIRSGINWTEQATLLASDGVIYDNFGISVAIDGETALIGAPGDSSPVDIPGKAYVFTRNGTIWKQEAELLASDGTERDFFGCSVSISDGTALIGAYKDDDNGFDSGSAYVFACINTSWTQFEKLLASDGVGGDYFGYKVSLNHNTALIGAFEDDDYATASGSAYVFSKTDLTISITGGLEVKVSITNNIPWNVTNVTWQIHVEGGLLGLINKTVNGNIDINAGESKNVGTGSLFGLGPIRITVTVTNGEETAKGIQFFIFSIIKD